VLRYQVRFEHTSSASRGVRHVTARNEAEAIARVRALVPGSYGHWVNGNATECV
jgi:hypothetical protein